MNDQFPVLGQPPYLNHAAIGPWPRCTADAVRAFAGENLHRGSTGYFDWMRREHELRERLARLAGAASADDIALLKNTTEGISLVAFGLDWREGDNVVLPAREFASNRLPWLAQGDRGVKVREVDIRTAADAEAALIDALDDRSRVLAVSAVQWDDGFRLDLGRLGEACHRRGVLFFVDAIQQLGALPMDVEGCHIDCLAADAHKWLLAPEGIAVFHCRPSVRERLTLLQRGWHMVDRPWEFDRDEWEPSASARRFEAGSPNSLGQAALHASVGLLLEFGMEFVGSRVLENTAFLLDALRGRPGIRITSRSEPARRSGIVSFLHEHAPSEDLYRGLRDTGVMCAMRGGSLRLSPHFYQDESVLESFLEILDHIV